MTATIRNPSKMNSFVGIDLVEEIEPLYQRLVARDLSRYDNFNARASNSTTLNKRQSKNAPVVNEITFYSAEIEVGSEGKKYKVIVDTGSSNTWVLEDFESSSTTTDTQSQFQITYGSGAVVGEQFTDRVKMGELVAENQGIGSATQHQGFEDAGILGLGPTSLTEGVLESGEIVDTIVDTLFKQGKIEAATIGVYFAPSTEFISTNGQLTFGGIDPSFYGPELVLASRSTQSPASEYFSADMTFDLGGVALTQRAVGGIIDTGTSLNLVASDILQAYATALAQFGGVAMEDLGLLAVPTDRVREVPDFNFVVDGVKLPLIGDAQFFPEEVNRFLGIPTNISQDWRFSTFASLGATSGQGLDYIMGMKTLERFATTYDSSSQRVGFYSTAATSLTYDELASTTPATFTPAFNTSAAAEPEGKSSGAIAAYSKTPIAFAFLAFTCILQACS